LTSYPNHKAGIDRTREFTQVAESFAKFGCRWGWEWKQRDLPNAHALARVVPELAKFVDAEPSAEVLAAWREAAALATTWLTAREASLRAHQQARAATAADASLVPSGHDMRLLVRYAAMNDRKIEKLLKLIAQHCGQPDEDNT